jgi:hypothetical protein
MRFLANLDQVDVLRRDLDLTLSVSVGTISMMVSPGRSPADRVDAQLVDKAVIGARMSMRFSWSSRPPALGQFRNLAFGFTQLRRDLRCAGSGRSG